MNVRNRVEVMHGVNLDQLGRRDPDQYGRLTLDELQVRIDAWADGFGLAANFFSTNHEGAFVERLHRLRGLADGVVLNPGAWTHYSYAIRDALEILDVPVVEVHLSQVDEREEWRRHSVIADVVAHRISGRGADGYHDAFVYLAEHSR